MWEKHHIPMLGGLAFAQYKGWSLLCGSPISGKVLSITFPGCWGMYIMCTLNVHHHSLRLHTWKMIEQKFVMSSWRSPAISTMACALAWAVTLMCI